MPPTLDEIAAAAGRLRRLAAGEGAGTVYAGLEHLGGAAFFATRDTGTLADAWLAANPADNAVLVTADWLTSIAHEPPTGDHDYWQWVYGDGQGRLCVWLRYGLWWCSVEEAGADRDSQLPPLATRGQLRRLLAALGVPAAQGGAP